MIEKTKSKMFFELKVEVKSFKLIYLILCVQNLTQTILIQVE